MIVLGYICVNNIGGLDGIMYCVVFSLLNWKLLFVGGVYEFDMVYYLLIFGFVNYSVNISGVDYVFKFE